MYLFEIISLMEQKHLFSIKLYLMGGLNILTLKYQIYFSFLFL